MVTLQATYIPETKRYDNTDNKTNSKHHMVL